jgi:hypothetical protein
MKVIVGAALAAFLMAGAAAAQNTETPAPAAPAAPAASSCAAIPSAPADLPDGANATGPQMQAGNTAYNTWMEGLNPVLTCRREEAQAAQARADSLREQYNTANAAAAAVNQSWVAEVEEFRGRRGR